ncbi:MAG: nucleotidyl transferase AbiEii/AbiGii toxin family protein [Patescibacteria group bacterium]
MGQTHFSILSLRQIRLLKKLEFLKERGFYLAGGTALAMQIGHRTSLDFDFYSKKEFISGTLQQLLEKKFKDAVLLQKGEGTLIMRISGVAVSFFQYPYPLVLPAIKHQGFPPLASLEDISAMKIIAVSDRGTKRDFIDIYFLLKKLSLGEIFNFVKRKYPNFNIYVGLRGLTYFSDAEKKQQRRLYLFYSVPWNKIKESLIQEVKKYQKICLE